MDLLAQLSSSARDSILRERTTLPRHYARPRFSKLPTRVRFGLRSFPCRLEHDNGKELSRKRGVIQSQTVDSDGVRATVLGANNLIEISDALQTVAKALEEVAVKKGLAQEEAAEWRHKYELERLRNAHLQRLLADDAAHDFSRQNESAAMPNVETDADYSGELSQSTQKPRNGASQSSETVSSEEGLNYKADSFSSLYLDTELEEKIPKKASFSLTCDPFDESSQTQCHDLDLFEPGDIKTEIRSNKQITLVWKSPPRSVLLLLKPNAVDVKKLCKEMVW